jgi:hypothetical protein
LPAAPQQAVVATPPHTVPGIIGELGSRGTRAAVVITAGVRNDLRQQMLDAARPHLLRIQGPNCLGLMVPGLGLNASFSHQPPLAGELAFLSQSGALITAIVDWARGHRVGFSHVVSLGDMADADFGDLLDYLAGDAKSRAILLYMEAVTHAPKFLSAARRAARSKPVIVVKAGRQAARRAALSHRRLAGAGPPTRPPARGPAAQRDSTICSSRQILRGTAPRRRLVTTSAAAPALAQPARRAGRLPPVRPAKRHSTCSPPGRTTIPSTSSAMYWDRAPRCAGGPARCRLVMN